MTIRVSDFVKRVPELARQQLPREYQGFKVFLMPWLSQVYYNDKRIHYETVKLPSRYGENRLEVGLHFEGRTAAENAALLAGFQPYLFELRDALGDEWYAEPWDRGWTKIYTAYTYEAMDDDLLDLTAKQLADAIRLMQPIYKRLRK